MQLNYAITLDLGAKMDVLGIVNAQVLPLMAQAVRGVAQQVQVNWQTEVHKAKLWSGEKDAYANSIKWHATGDFSAVVEADYKWAGDIETGRPARDLKRMLDTSHKVRRTASGKRFLVIPFRHNTPGASGGTPAAAHSLASALAPSSITGTGQRPVGQVTHLSPKTGMAPAAKQSAFLSVPGTKQAALTAQHSYSWGGRLTNAALKSAGMDAGTAKRHAGMVKMDTSTPGGAKSSAYMTFRIMMEGSSGWIVPPKPGLFLAKKVADDMQPKASAAFQAAAAATLKG